LLTQSQIDPVVSFRNAEGASVRGTIVNLQRKSIVMEVYNPYSIMQVSEVLSELTMRFGTHIAYQGKAVVISLVNTGLTIIASVTLIDEWRELNDVAIVPGSVRLEAQAFVQDWTKRFQIRHGYQIVVNEMRAYLSDVARWIEQVDLSESLPKANGRLRTEVFYELVIPLMHKMKYYLDMLEVEASLVDEELASAHRSFAQTALHPLLLRAPFVFRTYTKPLGYAGDYQMVNQILDDPRQGPSTYFQMVNAAFLQTAVAVAHRNRIDILVDFLKRMADAAMQAGRTFRILNIGCGPAIEIQRFLQTYPAPELLSFELVDFSAETLAWTREKLTSIIEQTEKPVTINYVQDSVHKLIKYRIDPASEEAREFDAVYCAGLFDYLSDKVCSRLTEYFAARTIHGGALLITNVHSSNPVKFCMEHLLDWYLIYRDEARIASLLPAQSNTLNIWVDATGVNAFAEAIII
jgi:extracellular factor (EF) 3-hydroxypalmitic acid methyl ester biosynthesis protein